MNYYVLPLIVDISDYRFRPSGMPLSNVTNLTASNRNAAINCLVENLGELHGA